MTLKTLGKRILALALAAVMCFSALHLNPMAADMKDQVMKGYFELNADGSVKSTIETAEKVQNGFTLSKTIEQTGVDAFEITLKVVTQQTVKQNASAIQLVIDRSNSMQYCANCGKSSCNCGVGNRMTAVKNAIVAEGGFLDRLLEGNEGKLYISVVVFSGNHNDSSVKDAYTVLDWTELTAESRNSIANTVNAINYDGGTNLQAGLTLAANRLSMDVIDTCSSKYTVLLTDGAPTYYTSSTSTSTSEITSTAGNGSNSTTYTINGGISGAEAVKAKSTLYTICYGESETNLIEGEETDICAHCENHKDDHYELCSRCKKAKSQHTGYRYCADGRRYSAGYFCDAQGNTQFTASVSGAMTIGQYLSGSIASNAGNAYDASDIADVYNAFSNIADSAISGMNGAGSTVTDPMGKFIVLGNVDDLNSVTTNENGISWELNEANLEAKTEGDTTTYTYTISYPITLNTSAEGFDENEYYPTNGYTYLSVEIDGEIVEIPFNVPGVCGEIPEYSWKVEYYLENENGTYTLADTDDMNAADLWSIVTAPEGYKTKYSKDHYEFAEGNTELQIKEKTEENENVMKLYYKRDLAKVTVNHFYKTTTTEADGTVTKGEYPADPQITESENKWIGTDFTAVAKPEYGGAAYEQQKADPKMEITVSDDEAKNVINIYYSREDDLRADTSAEVKHTYVTYGYELENGKYVLKEKSSVTVSAQDNENLKATTSYAVIATSPLQEGFELNKEKGDYAELVQEDGTLSFILKDNAEDNVRTLVFEKTVDERVPVTVTVNHYYTKTTTSVKDGEVITTIDPNEELGKTESFDTYYADESFTATQFNAYEGDTYNSDDGNADKCEEIALPQGNTVIDLYYNLAVAPETVSITVNHYWRTFTDVTVEDTDAEGNVIGTKVITETTVDHQVEDIVVSDLYEGQNYAAALQSIEGGYEFNELESNRTITVQNGAEINLYYDRSATDDARNDASIDVQHNYTTYLSTIVEGKVETVIIKNTVSEDSVSMKAGDAFTAVAKPTYNGDAYTQTTGNSALSVILQPGTNATIVINYEREASDLIATKYNVNFVYKTFTMTVNEEGVAGYWNAPTEETVAAVVDAAGYVDQKVTLPTGEKEGFAARTSNPATEQILAAVENTWTFEYEKYIPLDLGSVTVNHHYKTITIAENGTASEETEVVSGEAKEMYIGESFLAEFVSRDFQLVSAKLDGSELVAAIADDEAAAQGITVVVSGDNVVDIYYEKTVDNSRLVDYTISHIYNLYTYNGELISSQKADDITGSGYVTTEVAAVPTPAGYELVSATYNDAALEAPYTITLADGENAIVFVYEQYLPREEVEVTVIHNYYEETVDGDPVEVYEEIVSGISEDTEYTAQAREEDGFEFHSANPSNLTVFATKDGENVIILNYVRVKEDPPIIEIPDEEVPLAPAPEEEEPPVVEIPDEDVPLAEVPKTGDATVLYTALTTLSGVGLAVLGLKKKEEDEE